MKNITQFCQTVVLGTYYLLQGFKHQPVTGFIEIQLHPQYLLTLQGKQSVYRRKNHHHTVFIHIIHRRYEIQVIQLTRYILCEETDRTTILKLMLNFLILPPFNLYDQLIKGIVIIPPQIQRIPAHSTFDFPSYSHQLCLLLELFLFIFVLHLQQFILMLQIKYRRFYSRIFFHTPIILHIRHIRL